MSGGVVLGVLLLLTCCCSSTRVYEQQRLWRQRRDARLQRQRQQRTRDQLHACTFQPALRHRRHHHQRQSSTLLDTEEEASFLTRQQLWIQRARQRHDERTKVRVMFAFEKVLRRAVQRRQQQQEEEERELMALDAAQQQQQSVEATAVYERSCRWEQQRQQKRALFHVDLELERMSQCTFEPDLLSVRNALLARKHGPPPSTDDERQGDDDENEGRSGSMLSFREWKARTELGARATLYTSVQHAIRTMADTGGERGGERQQLLLPSRCWNSDNSRCRQDMIEDIRQSLSAELEGSSSNSSSTTTDAGRREERSAADTIVQLLSGLSQHSLEDAERILSKVSMLLLRGHPARHDVNETIGS